MKFTELPPDYQAVITMGCRAMQSDVALFWDGLCAVISGVKNEVVGWQEIAYALGMTNAQAAYKLANRDPLLKCLMMKRGNSVVAYAEDLKMYSKRKLREYR